VLAAEARRLGIPLRAPFRYRFATDGQIPLRAGYPTVTLTSMDARKAPSHYHWPSDRPEGLHLPSAAAAARLAEAYARRLDAAASPSTRSSPALANRPSGSSSSRTAAKRSQAG
jgi:Iap family predicted aminopeptidase